MYSPSTPSTFEKMSGGPHRHRNPSRLAIKLNSNFIHYKLPTYKRGFFELPTKKRQFKVSPYRFSMFDCRHVRAQRDVVEKERGGWWRTLKEGSRPGEAPGGSYGLHCSCRQETLGLFLISGVLLKL